MKQAGAVLLLFLFLTVALSAAVSRVGTHAVDVWAEQASRPLSATEAVLQSRQTPVEAGDSNGRSGWWGAGLLALGLVVVGGILFLLRGGSAFLRQWRLLWKRPSARRAYPRTIQGTVPHYPEYPEAEPVRAVRRTPYLPEGDDDDQTMAPHN